MKQCPDCGENLADDAVHCGHCGAKVEESEDDGGKTMFGMGALTDEDLAQAAGEAGGEGGDGDDNSGGGFRLPRPSEMDGEDADESEDRADSTSGSEEGERPGLKGPAADSDASPYAETEALPSLDEGKSGKQQDASDDLKGGRLSTPSPERGDVENLGASPDLSADSSPPSSSDGSPFAGDDEQPSSETDGRETARSAGPATTSQQGDSPVPEAAGGGVQEQSEEESEGMPETADMISTPEDAEEPAAEETDFDRKDTEREAVPERDVRESRDTPEPREAPSREAASAPADESEQPRTATAEAPDEKPSRDPLAEDERFAGPADEADEPLAKGAEGNDIGKQELDMRDPASSPESGSNQKTLLIVGGIIAASLFMCVGGIFLAWFFGLI